MDIERNRQLLGKTFFGLIGRAVPVPSSAHYLMSGGFSPKEDEGRGET